MVSNVGFNVTSHAQAARKVSTARQPNNNTSADLEKLLTKALTDVNGGNVIPLLLTALLQQLLGKDGVTNKQQQETQAPPTLRDLIKEASQETGVFTKESLEKAAEKLNVPVSDAQINTLLAMQEKINAEAGDGTEAGTQQAIEANLERWEKLDKVLGAGLLDRPLEDK